MQTAELLDILQSISPFELQEKWDNSGLIVGSATQEFKTLAICLEIDEEVIANAPNDTMFIVHHPLIFTPLKQLIADTYPANLLTKMLRKNQQCIAMHTNFDKTHFSKYVVNDILGITPNENYEASYITTFLWTKSFEDLCKHIHDKLNCKTLKIATTKTITKSFNQKAAKNIALITGSGSSLFRDIPNLDCLISGDCKYHDAMIAHSLGISIIDCGHYELECYFGEILQPILKNKGYEAIIIQSHNPFTYL